MRKIEAAMYRIDTVLKFHRLGAAIAINFSGGKGSEVVYHLIAQKCNYPWVSVIHKLEDSTHPATGIRIREFEKKHQGKFYTVDETTVLDHKWIELNVFGTRREGTTPLIAGGKLIDRSDLVHFHEGVDGKELYPIYDWTDTDVFQYLAAHHIPISREFRDM